MKQRKHHNTATDAQAIAREFKEFVYSVSHDLSTPLRSMVEFSRLLADETPEDLSEEAGLYLSMIIKSGEQIQNQITGLLDYYHLGAECQTVSQVDCNQVIEHCKTKLKDKITISYAKLTFPLLPVIHMNTEQCRLLFLALLDNAIKFRAPNRFPDISISAQKQENTWLFCVIDNGIGIEDDCCDSIFLPFRRLHSEQEYAGNGMGLTLARKIVLQLGGEMWIESTPGIGSAFFFTLPIKA
jgi:light-regulated signal transduction histidine kinase (bacteriophytochrome)